MRIFILLAGLFLMSVRAAYGQEDSIASVREVDNIYTATLKTTHMSIDLSSPEDVEQVLKKIHNYKYLQSLTFEGPGNESDLKKLFYRISVLKNISSITFIDNELLKIPDNISLLKNLQSLTIEGNSELDLTDLCAHLKTLALTQLNLVDNDLKKAPPNFAELSSLKKLQITGSDQMDYADLVEQLARIKGLTTLSIPLNYITDLPTNIDKLRSLLVLDVSNNNLSELPGEISGLKTINNLSIQGNLLLDPAKELEKLKGSNIQYLSLDKEISGEDLEKIKKMFPDAQIDFPVNKDVEETTETKKTTEPITPPVYSGELNIKKETSVLSGAYLNYPTFFQGLNYVFDTLTFDERYTNLQYENVRQIVRINGARQSTACLFMRTWCLRLEKPGKKDETWFRFATNNPRVSNSYPELRAFGGMYWVYKGELSKRKFRKKFLGKKRRMKTWNDVRIEYEKNNSLFNIKLKCDTGFISFSAYPVIADISIERSQQTYNRRYVLYKKSLLRRAQRFNRNLARSKRSNDLLFNKLKDYAWQELQLRMSNEEKAMSREDWLKYYDKIIANEQKALDKSALTQNFIMRSLQLRGYTLTTSSAQLSVSANPNPPGNYGTKIFNADLVDSNEGGKLVVATIFIIDNKSKKIEQLSGTLGLMPDLIPLKQFTSQSLLVELRNGNWGYVSSAELDKQIFEPNKVFKIQTQVFDRNLDTIGDLLKNAFK